MEHCFARPFPTDPRAPYQKPDVKTAISSSVAEGGQEAAATESAGELLSLQAAVDTNGRVIPLTAYRALRSS